MIAISAQFSAKKKEYKWLECHKPMRPPHAGYGQKVYKSHP